MFTFSGRLLAMTGLAAATGVVLGTTGMASAGVIPVQNYSFEDGYTGGTSKTGGDGATYYNHQGTIPGWAWSGNFDVNDTGLMQPGPNNFDTDADGNLIAPADGKFLAWAGSTDSRSPLLTYTGTTLGTYVAGTTYTLSVALGLPTTQSAHQYGTDSTIRLTDRQNGNATIATSPDIATPAGGTFEDFTLTYTATAADAGKEIGIVIAPRNIYAQDAVDNVRLSSSVPEPASLALIALGLGLIALPRRRRAFPDCRTERGARGSRGQGA